MTMRSAACSLATTGAASPETGSPASSPLLTPTAHYRTSCRLCGTQGSRVWLSPCALLPNTPALSRQG